MCYFPIRDRPLKKTQGLINLPAKHCHHKSHGWKHVAHCTGEGWGCELQPSIVEILINHRPVL